MIRTNILWRLLILCLVAGRNLVTGFPSLGGLRPVAVPLLSTPAFIRRDNHGPYSDTTTARRQQLILLWAEKAPHNQPTQKKTTPPFQNLHLLQTATQNKGSAFSLRRTFPNVPWHRVPNWLTYTRCAAIPLLMGYFYQPLGHATTSMIFAAASLTDFLDGYLARKWECSTAFGAFLDPVADKLMVSTALILLSGRYGMYVAVPASIILARELAVSALREWMAQIGARDTVKVGWQGKCKTALTMVALTVMLYCPPVLASQSSLVSICLPLGLVLLYAATVLTITSGWVYFAAAAPYLLDQGSS